MHVSLMRQFVTLHKHYINIEISIFDKRKVLRNSQHQSRIVRVPNRPHYDPKKGESLLTER